MILQIKEKLEKQNIKKIKICVDVGRNKYESYEGVILDTYKNIWTFKTDADIKSFCYSDILINSVVISSWDMNFFCCVYWFLFVFVVKLKCIY